MGIDSENKNSKPDCDWIYPGAWVIHEKFGKGKIQSIGEYKNTPMLVIEFSFGEKMLSQEHGVPHLSPWKDEIVQGEESKFSWIQKIFGKFRK